MQIGYKETKIGVIPEEWNVEQLGSIGAFFKGKTITKSEITETGFPCIRYGDIYVQYEFANIVTHFSAYISEETAKNGRRLLKGDIIFAGTGETQEDIGKCVAYTRDEKAFAGGDLIVFRPNKDIGIDSEFLSSCLNTGETAKRKSRLGQGLSIFHIYSDHLKTLEVPIPPLSEQKKIATILSTVDDAIEKIDAIIEETKQLKKGLMQKLFTKGIGHTKFKETKIGTMPEAWKVVKLGDFIKLASGKSRPKDYKNEQDDLFMFPIYGGNGILGYSKIFNFDTQTIIIGRVGEYCGAIYRNEGKCWISDNALYIKGYLDKSFDVHFLSVSLEYKNFNRFKAKSGQPLITQSVVYSQKICLPHIDEQIQIAKILSDMDAKINKEQATKEQLKRLKKGLIQVLLTGKVRVKV